MAAVADSGTAMAAVLANSTALAAVVASGTAMAAVADSGTAMAAVFANSAALAAVVASGTAMAAVADSGTGMAAVAASSTAMAAVVTSSTAMAALEGSSYIGLFESSPLAQDISVGCLTTWSTRHSAKVFIISQSQTWTTGPYLLGLRYTLLGNETFITDFSDAYNNDQAVNRFFDSVTNYNSAGNPSGALFSYKIIPCE
jgi:hypothetical protein